MSRSLTIDNQNLGCLMEHLIAMMERGTVAIFQNYDMVQM